jgi:hypothetical protein
MEKGEGKQEPRLRIGITECERREKVGSADYLTIL